MAPLLAPAPLLTYQRWAADLVRTNFLSDVAPPG